MFPIIMGVRGLGSTANSLVPMKKLQLIFTNAVCTVVIFPSANCRLTFLFVQHMAGTKSSLIIETNDPLCLRTVFSTSESPFVALLYRFKILSS